MSARFEVRAILEYADYLPEQGRREAGKGLDHWRMVNSSFSVMAA